MLQRVTTQKSPRCPVSPYMLLMITFWNIGPRVPPGLYFKVREGTVDLLLWTAKCGAQ